MESQVDKTNEDGTGIPSDNRASSNRAGKTDSLLVSYPYKNPTGTEFPIIAYNNYLFPKKSQTTENEIRKELQTIKDCGFNATIWEFEDVSTCMDLFANYSKSAKSLGLRTMISNLAPMVIQKYNTSNSKITDGICFKPSLSGYGNVMNLGAQESTDDGDSNLWGYYIAHELKYASWGYDTVTAPAGLPDLLEAYRLYLQNLNGQQVFLNLAVSAQEIYVGKEIAELNRDECVKYSRYLKTLEAKFDPPMLSVNLFPIFKDSTTSHYSIISKYYDYLEEIALYSDLSGIPFWLFMLSNQHTTKNNKSGLDVEYPFPSEGVLSFQAMTALAFGFQGLVFWTYALPVDKSEDTNVTDYITAPYVYVKDGDTVTGGKVTDVWYNCKAVISEIQTYGKILLGAKFDWVRHINGPFIPNPDAPQRITLPPQFGCITNATATGTGFIITHLSKGSSEYVAIVSHNPFTGQTITLTFATGYDWKEELPSGSVVEEYRDDAKAAQEQTVSRYLKPGGMILISYRKTD